MASSFPGDSVFICPTSSSYILQYTLGFAYPYRVSFQNWFHFICIWSVTSHCEVMVI